MNRIMLLAPVLCLLACAVRADVRFAPEDIAEMHAERLLDICVRVEAMRAAPATEVKPSNLASAEQKLTEMLNGLDAENRKLLPAALTQRETSIKDVLAKRGDKMPAAEKEKLTQRLKAIEVLRAKLGKTAGAPESHRGRAFTVLAGLLLSASLAGLVLVQRRS